MDNETGKLLGLIPYRRWSRCRGQTWRALSSCGVSWVDYGGGDAEVQDKVAALLEDLRKADKEGVKK